jgi:hypothetical protein
MKAGSANVGSVNWTSEKLRFSVPYALRAPAARLR